MVVHKTGISKMQYNQELFKIAIAMGATIGLSYFTWLLSLFNVVDSDIISFTGAIFLLIQQCIITSTFVCTKKMSNLCKMFFSRDQD